MKRETSISRRSLLVGTACAALGALTGCTAPEPTRRTPISYAVFCLKKKKK